MVLVFLAFLTPAKAQTPPISPYTPPGEVFMPKVLEPSEVKELARTTAISHGLDVNKFVWVVGCESSYKYNAKGDGGYSHGVVQIHAPSHPQITLEQAEDPHFALEWMANEWKSGRSRQWTCARMYSK